MRAIQVRQFGGPEELRLESVAVPEPGPGQVRVRVKAAGVNPVDTYWRSGTNPALPLPFTPGLDGAGIVEALGAGVSRVREGNSVYFGGWLSGAYAEQALLREAQAHRLPQGATFSQGAALHVPYATAHRALFHRGQARPGEVVLVHGASGGVGMAATQFALAAGLRVIATAGSQRGREWLAAQGAHAVLDHSDPSYIDSIRGLTGGRGVDLILEMLSNVNLGKDLPLLAGGGRVVVIGSRGPVQINARDLMTREADVRGMSLFNVADDALIAIHEAIAAGWRTGVVRPVVRREMPLAEAAAAHQAVLEAGAFGKIVLIP
ncbi:MAG: NADPH:quinone reductase [Verrucomicrobia bacterium]|nr:NADPH:quinone reductase [Verrucomicrobiota bacterium]